MAMRDVRALRDDARVLLGAFFLTGHGGLPGYPPEAWVRSAAARGDRDAQEKCQALGLRWMEEV